MTTSSSGYPAAARSDICDDLNGHLVADPYRWLEDPGSPATQEWLAAQKRLVRFPQDQPSATGDRHVYQDQPPV